MEERKDTSESVKGSRADDDATSEQRSSLANVQAHLLNHFTGQMSTKRDATLARY